MQAGLLRHSISMPSLALLMLIAAPSHASSIYRWVDAQGHTHFSDAVPAPYQKSSSVSDSKQFDLTAVQRKEALERQQEDARRLEAAASASDGASTPAVGHIDSQASAPAAMKPLTCAQKMAAYRQSEACFAPYKLVNGGTKAEAFKHCKVVAQPNCQ